MRSVRDLRLAIVAGESSGDILASRSLRALRAALPERRIVIEGIGGSAMRDEGHESLYPMERLAVMGLIEPLGRLPELLRLRRDLGTRWLADPPDLFLGVDAPDFNLGLARRLRRAGIATAQLVSPTVWAWRPGRVHKIARSVDDLFCLFPFEPACYDGLNLRTHFVGHPLVREMHEAMGRTEARELLGLKEQAPVIALLPGSRGAEVEQHGEVLVRAGRLLRSRDPTRRLVMPAASKERLTQCTDLLARLNAQRDVLLVEGHSREVMAAADVILLASGTATLEAMLLRRPMAIVYRVSPASAALMKRLAVTNMVGLPNILAGRNVVPELLQESLTAPALALEAETLLGRGGRLQVDALGQARAAMEFDFDSEIGTGLARLLVGKPTELSAS